MATRALRVDCVLDGRALAQWTAGRWIGGSPSPGGICLDSRAIRDGDLFVALLGSSTDGHLFLAHAQARGSCGAVVSRVDPAVRMPQLLVKDTLVALHAMASGHRASFGGKIVAVTGSVGKTTVKEMTAAILRQAGATIATPANFNNVTGVPLTLLSLTPEARYAVVEIGMSFPGEIRRLVPLVKPWIAAVTNVRPVHLENFPDLEAIARAKAEILEGLDPDGVAVLNADDPLVRALVPPKGQRRVWFGTAPDADLVLLPDASVTLARQRFRLAWRGQAFEVSLAVPGVHNRVNAAAAATLALCAGATVEQVVAGLASFSSVEMRSTLRRLRDGSLLLEDCYNASPSAVTIALRTLCELPVEGRRVVVLGDMRELGPSGPSFHWDAGALAARLGVECLLGFGPLSAHAVDAYSSLSDGVGMHFDSIEALASFLLADHRAGDVVLVKGSRAMRLERVVGELLAKVPPEDGTASDTG